MSGRSLCPECGAELQWSMDRCPKCRRDVGAPNKREIDTAEEKTALEDRLQAAMSTADKNGVGDRVRSFEAAIRSKSRAVVNVWPALLHDFLSDQRVLYSNYNLQVRSEARKPASPSDDRQRRGTEGILFGAYAEQIRYGALSLDGVGLISYGSCSMAIANTTAAACATVLEENSYTFVQNHQLLGKQIPCGFRALWKGRHQLAVAKLAKNISRRTGDSSFPKILLYSDGNRARDEFLEVHFYGTFDRQSVDGVVAPKIAKVEISDRPFLEISRDWLKREGKTWIEQ